MKRFALAATLILFAGTAFAQEESDSEWRVFAGAAFSDYSADAGTTGVDDSTTGVKFGAQYRFNSWFGIEGAYTGTGDFETDIAPNEVGGFTQVSLRGLSIAAIGYVPLVDDIDLYGKVGYFDFDTDVSTDAIITQSGHTDGFTVGAGATIRISDEFGIKSDFDWYDADGADLWVITLGLEYRF